MELSERVLTREPDVSPGIWEHDLHQCLLLAREVVTVKIDMCGARGAHGRVNCTILGMATMPCVFAPSRGSCRQVPSSKWGKMYPS